MYKAGGSGKEELNKKPPPTPTVVLIVNVHEKKRDRKKATNTIHKSCKANVYINHMCLKELLLKKPMVCVSVLFVITGTFLR